MSNSDQREKRNWYDNKTLIVVLLILFFPVGLYALWKNRDFSKNAKWAITAGVAFLVILALAEEPDTSNTTLDASTPETVSTETDPPEPSPPKTLEQSVSEVAVEALGKTVNWDGRPATIMNISTIEQVAGEDEGGYLVDIEYRANDNLTTGMTRGGMINDAMELIEKLSTTSEFSEVKIYMLKPHLTLVDKYGNESVDQVGKIVLRKAIADRINWDNMYADAFEAILQTDGQLWLHPALRK